MNRRRFHFLAVAPAVGMVAAANFLLPLAFAKPPAVPNPPAMTSPASVHPAVQEKATPAADSIESLMAEAIALQGREKYSDALLLCASAVDRFPGARPPLERMEMIAAFLRSNAFDMTQARFVGLRTALEAAAARNVVSAQMLLGEKLRNVSPADALKWFMAAAENGQTEAMTQAGLMLANGRGTSGPDLGLAFNWFQRAADHGDTDAMAALAECLIFGKGTEKDPHRAAAILQTATAFNHPRSMNLLGDLYVRGSGVPRNYAEALRLFSRSSGLGLGDATANLGVLYMRGLGVPANPSKAVSLWRAGAEKGSPACMLNLAKAFESGSGTPADAFAARRWYVEAARAGSDSAIQWCRRNGAGL